MSADMTTTAWNGQGLASRAYLSYLRNFPSVRGKLRLGRSIAEHLGSLSMVGENGARFELDPADWISWIIAMYGENGCETRSMRLASKLVSGGGTVLDVGAAWGIYTCTLGVLPGVRVVSVEPTPRNFIRLQANIARNPGVHASAYAVALGDAPGVLAMGATVHGNSLTMSAVTPQSIEYYAAVVTPTMVLESAGIDKIRLMKIDVEGSEMRVFRAWPWERIQPDHILCEFHAPSIAAAGETVAGMLGFFRERGYVARSVDEKPYKDGEDILEENLLLSRASS
jgi:FkbM family methyltransferase